MLFIKDRNKIENYYLFLFLTEIIYVYSHCSSLKCLCSEPKSFIFKTIEEGFYPPPVMGICNGTKKPNPCPDLPLKSSSEDRFRVF